jgi:hypothetical protein
MSEKSIMKATPHIMRILDDEDRLVSDQILFAAPASSYSDPETELRRRDGYLMLARVKNNPPPAKYVPKPHPLWAPAVTREQARQNIVSFDRAAPGVLEQFGYGVVKGLGNTVDTFERISPGTSLLRAAEIMTPVKWINEKIQKLENPMTVPEEFASQIGQFVPTFLLGLKGADRVIPLLKDTGRFSRFFNFTAKPTAAGITAEQLAFDPAEPRLSDAIEEAGWSNPVTRTLRSDPSDSELLSRTKMVAEGFLSGLIPDMPVSMARGVLSGRFYDAMQQRLIRKYLDQGFNEKQAKYLASPYNGQGHHFISQTWLDKKNVPRWVIDSPLNVRKPSGISVGDFYELHYKVDPSYGGSALPWRSTVGGGRWKGGQLGMQKYDKAGRLWHGSPTALKLSV